MYLRCGHFMLVYVLALYSYISNLHLIVTCMWSILVWWSCCPVYVHDFIPVGKHFALSIMSENDIHVDYQNNRVEFKKWQVCECIQ